MSVVVLAAAPGCSRTPARGDGADAAPAVVTSASSPAPVSSVSSASSPVVPAPSEAAKGSPRAPVSGHVGSGLEARRSSVTRVDSDPILAANADVLRKQYGGALPASMAVQATDLGADRRRAILVASERKDGSQESPMLFVVDERGAVLWSKERPAAGIKTPVGPLAIAAGPHGRFAMAACDPPTSSVALRLWDEDGSPFADFQALETKACDTVTLLYWPGHGWIIAIAAGSEIRAQLVSEAGALTWGAGKVLGARFRTIAPASLAADGASAFVLVQYAQSPGADRDADHAIAYRYDARGEPSWPAPVDLGAVRRVPPGQERILLFKPDATLRAKLMDFTVEIKPNGEARRIP